MTTKATVRVRVVVEVSLNANWGADCTVAQVHSQGTREATEAVQRKLAGEGFRVLEAKACDMVTTLEGKP